MNCATCGSENAAHLVFCQDCGQRLGPRVAPPTPPVGLSPPAGVPRVESGTARPPPHVLAAAANIHDLAATFPSAGSSGSSGASAAQQAAPATIPCPNCGARSHAGMRFCVTCGQSLTGAPSYPPSALNPGAAAASPRAGSSPSFGDRAQDVAATSSPYPSHEPPTPVAPIGHSPIAPMPMIDLRPHEPPATKLRACARCRGSNEGNAPFCKFCGAPLADAAPIAAVPSAPMTDPSPRAAPRPANARAPSPAAQPVAAAAAQQYSAPPPYGAPPPYAPPPYVAPPAAIAKPAPPRQPSAPPMTQATVSGGRLVLVARDGTEGQQFLIGDQLDIGRLEGEVRLDDPYVSPRHARVLRRGASFVVRDLDATNGVYIRIDGGGDVNPIDPTRGSSNAHAHSPKSGGAHGSGQHPRMETDRDVGAVLADQDLFLVGQQVIRFDFVNDAEEGFGSASEHGTLLFGTPAAPRYARLCQRTVEGVVRDVFYIRKTETILGREVGDIVFTDDPFLSRRHAVIRLDKERKRWSITDLGSSNGTFLKIRGEVSLKTGDHFRIGQQLFRFDAVWANPQGAS